MNRIADMDVKSLILLVGAVVLVTVLTQAFQFTFIRLVEGYWGSLGDRRWRKHVASKRELVERHRLLEREAFKRARPTMLDGRLNLKIVDILEDDLWGRSDHEL
jgi:hypothetical protein